VDATSCWYSRIDGQVSDSEEPLSSLQVHWEWWDDGVIDEAPAVLDALGQTFIEVPEEATVRLVVEDAEGHVTSAQRGNLDGLDCS
jgi:hypothetical protein